MCALFHASLQKPPFSSSFLQSEAWERIQQQAGNKTWRIGSVLVIRHVLLPYNYSYLYMPRPNLREADAGAFYKEAEMIAHREHALYLKIDPLESLPLPAKSCRESAPLQPRQSIIADLSRTEAELRAALHPKTRYNIGLAERRGVTIVRVAPEDAEKSFSAFWRLMRETASRDGFSLHEERYYRILAATRAADGANELLFAYYNSTLVAAALVNIYQAAGTATYLHGASSAEHRAVMAPQLLHWHIMCEMKRLGLLWYDLWGIDAARWPGVTRFKRGFGGREIEYPPSCDIVYRLVLYQAVRVAKKIRRR